jgi:putative ABC transport system ATP-binding protein
MSAEEAAPVPGDPSGWDGDLVLSDVVVEYRSGPEVVRPLDGFSARVEDGSLALLLGPSGCGKTSLLSCLAGILSPAAGTIRHGEREVTSLRGPALDEYRRHGVGVVFQSFNLIPSLSAVDNVALPARLDGEGAAPARARAAALLAHVGLEDRLGAMPAQLSGGQQQRVAICRAQMLDPPLILADEPTAHLDHVQVEVTLRVLRGLARPGRVVVVVTHDDRLLPLADQVIELVPHAAASPDAAPVTVELAAGQDLFAQGDAADLIYEVVSGSIELWRRVPDGPEELLATRGAGDYFGEMGPLFGLPRSAGARAAEPSVLVGYTVQAFRSAFGPDRLDRLVRR